MVFGLAVRCPHPCETLCCSCVEITRLGFFALSVIAFLGFDAARDGFDLAPRIALLIVEFSAFFLGEFFSGDEFILLHSVSVCFVFIRARRFVCFRIDTVAKIIVKPIKAIRFVRVCAIDKDFVSVACICHFDRFIYVVGKFKRFCIRREKKNIGRRIAVELVFDGDGMYHIIQHVLIQVEICCVHQSPAARHSRRRRSICWSFPNSISIGRL